VRTQRWFVYALGGGLGHLTRALALARVAVRRGHSVELVTNSPFAAGLNVETLLGSGGTVHRLDAAWDRRAVAAAVASLLADARPEVLVVDTFPRGLGGELASLLPSVRARKVLVHRDLNPAYVARFELGLAVDGFDLLLVPGEPAPFSGHPRAVLTAPWVLLEPAELMTRSAARRALGAEGESRPLVVVSGCGRAEEVEESRSIAARLAASLGDGALVRCVVPLPEGEGIWPLLSVLPGVDVLVGAGGYNTVQEARVTGTPLVALARPRLYDRQALRLRPSELAASVEALLARVPLLLREGSARAAPRYVSGTHAAVDLIERLGLSA
jgi:hypothetical protein